MPIGTHLIYNVDNEYTIRRMTVLDFKIQCTINLAISNVKHLILLTLVLYRHVITAMTRTGFKAKKTTNFKRLPFKLAFGESKNCRRGQHAKIASIARNQK